MNCGRSAALACALVLGSCQSSTTTTSPAWQLRPGPTLPGVRVAQTALHGQAFAAEAAFLFPEQSRALVHALLRAEFARLEARRLGVQIDTGELDAAFAASLETLQAGLATNQDFESWAQNRYGRSWSEVQGVLRRHLADNQLYQLCTRAYSLHEGQVILQMLTTRDSQTAIDWARRLASGASVQVLAQVSLDPGPQGDGSLPPLPIALPGELGLQTKGNSLAVGQILGPFQFAGETVWRVVRVRQLLPPGPSLPPTSILLESLRAQPVSPLEEQAWFEAMSRRYTATDQLPAFQPPPAAFVSSQA
jgi:phage gp36-like protein